MISDALALIRQARTLEELVEIDQQPWSKEERPQIRAEIDKRLTQLREFEVAARLTTP